MQLVFHDVLAALGSAGTDVLRELDIPKSKTLFTDQLPNVHKIVGVEEVKDENDVMIKPKGPGIDVENMTLTISALMKGSLMAVQQGIPSSHKIKSLGMGWIARQIRLLVTRLHWRELTAISTDSRT